jgi:hypothetical protein
MEYKTSRIQIQAKASAVPFFHVGWIVATFEPNVGVT